MLTLSEKDKILKEWERLRSENAPLRIIKDGKVIGMPSDYIDNVIFTIVGDNEIMATKIYENFPWDKYPVKVTFINCRLRQLIEEGKIIVIKEGWVMSGFYGAPMKDPIKNIIKLHT